MAWGPMVDLALTDEEKLDCDLPCMPMNRPKYPYGTCLTFEEAVLAKLKLDISDACVGDVIDMRCFGTITAISQQDSSDGPRRRVEIQIEKIKVEDENTESESPGGKEEPDEPKPKSKLRSLYEK